MFTFASLMAIYGVVKANLPTAIALGMDVAELISKGKEVLASDTGMSPEERTQLEAEIVDLQSVFDARLEELKSLDN